MNLGLKEAEPNVRVTLASEKDPLLLESVKKRNRQSEKGLIDYGQELSNNQVAQQKQASRKVSSPTS